MFSKLQHQKNSSENLQSFLLVCVIYFYIVFECANLLLLKVRVNDNG